MSTPTTLRSQLLMSGQQHPKRAVYAVGLRELRPGCEMSVVDMPRQSIGFRSRTVEGRTEMAQTAELVA